MPSRVGVQTASTEGDAWRFCIQNGANHRHHGVRLFTCSVNLSLIMNKKEERCSDVEYFQANWIYCDNKQALNGKINYSLKLCIINQVSGLLFVAFLRTKSASHLNFAVARTMLTIMKQRNAMKKFCNVINFTMRTVEKGTERRLIWIFNWNTFPPVVINFFSLVVFVSLVIAFSVSCCSVREVKALQLSIIRVLNCAFLGKCTIYSPLKNLRLCEKFIY